MSTELVVENKMIDTRKREFVHHVRHPFNESRYIGTVAVVEHDGEICMGMSQLHPNDDFSKKVGREIALGRAHHKTGQREVPFITYNQLTGTKIRHYPITQALADLLKKAEELWTD